MSKGDCFSPLRLCAFAGNLSLTEERDDVLDELVNSRKHVRTRFDGDAQNDDAGQNEPRNEAKERRAADEQTRVCRRKLDQTAYSYFYSRRVVSD